MKKIAWVIDDDLGILEAIRFFLEDEDIIVKTFLNKDSLYSELRKGELPDIVILDILLSGANGQDIAWDLKHVQKIKNIPIILMSASVKIGKNVQKSGADDFIEKPFDLSQFSIMVKKHLH